MKRITTGYRFGRSLDDLPEPNWTSVSTRLKKAKLLDQEASFVAFLNSATAWYWRQKIRDEMSATPAQVRTYAKRLKGVVANLDPKDDIEATILRAAISPFEYADRIGQVEAVVAAIEALQTETQDGSGPRLEHARQIRLAGRFWGAFKSNGWPLETSTNSLMNQLLMLVLDAAGEKRGTINRLLAEAELNT